MGIYYPKIGRPKGKYGHHLLAWDILGDAQYDKYFGEGINSKDLLVSTLVADIKSSKCHSIVLSSEEFDKFKEGHIDKLKNVFTEFNVKILAYLRRKDEFLESSYQTMVMYGKESGTISEAMKGTLNYYTFIKNWRDVFDEENVIIHFYCKHILKSQNIVVDFYDAMEINVEEMVSKTATQNINVSVPFQYVTMIANLRREGASDEILNSIKRIVKKIGNSANKEYHFLPLNERIKLANSGLEEIKRLGLSLPDKECFSLSSLELNEKQYRGNNSAMKQVFEDFENYIHDTKSTK